MSLERQPEFQSLEVVEYQPRRHSTIWKHNRLATARHTLTPREHKLVLYVMSMIQPEDEAFKLYRINVADFAAIAGLDKDHLYEELREVAVGLKSKPLVIEGHYEAGDSTPGVLITSWFDAAFIQPNGSGSFGVTISPYLKPYLLQVKREFFKYNLGYVVRLKSSYSIRLYEWAKRWQFAGKRRIELDELRQVLGAVELNKMGGIKKYLLVPYKNLKARAIDPAVKELNANTEVSISYTEHKDGKRVVALTFLFRQNSKNAAKLDTMQIPRDAQMELEIELVQKPEQATAEIDSDREAALLEAKVQPEFGLSARQLDMVREFIEKKGIEYVREKIAVVDSEPRKNAARTFLAALKGDWKLPVKRKPPPIPKSQPPPQEPPPEISDEEWAKQREKALATFNEFKRSMCGGPKEDATEGN